MPEEGRLILPTESLIWHLLQNEEIKVQSFFSSIRYNSLKEISMTILLKDTSHPFHKHNMQKEVQ